MSSEEEHLTNRVYHANLALLDPQRYGWTCGSGVADVLTPHERARRTKKSSKKRDRSTAFCRNNNTDKHLSAEAFLDGPVDDSLEEETTTGRPPQNNNDDDKNPAVCNDDDATNKAATEEEEEEEGGEEEQGKPLRFSALQSDTNTVNIYAYHRGIAGRELRDEQTGKLLLDVKATDTNHSVSGPKTYVVTIHVAVPLDNNCSFRHSFEYNLRDEQQTPMEMANKLASQVGLSYAQTWELSESIQKQLRDFCADQCMYRPPVLVNNVQQPPSAMVPQLYDDWTGFGQMGGVFRPLRTARSISRSSSFRKNSVAGKKPSKSGGLDRVYTDHVLSRLLEESRADIECKTHGEVRAFGDLLCHKCSKPQTPTKCGVFGCGEVGHHYCLPHLLEAFTHLNEDDPLLRVDHCPICSLSCDCPSCIGKLDRMTLEFANRSELQNADPSHTEFPHILDYCKHLSSEALPPSSNKTTKKRKSSITAGPSLLPPRSKVPKVLNTDFPREVVNGVDIDCEFDADYNKVFTKRGKFVSPKPQPEELAANSVVMVTSKAVEDGSVDYCNVCKKFGNLICCDYCPRAFHRECLGNRLIDKEDSPWQCVCCVAEREGQLDDKLDGAPSMSAICNVFDNVLKNEMEDLRQLKALSIIHQMCKTLIACDFGYMFAAPVDLNDLPTYSAVVKNPMDLGTIVGRLTDGWYKDQNGVKFSFDRVIAAVLKDVDLVWHNCFLFNREGSAVFRMAQVLKRRARSIRLRSFDDLLSDSVKEAEKVFLAEHEQELAASKALVQQAKRRTSRYKISASGRMQQFARPVVVLDPDTGAVVKIYSSMQSCVNASSLLLNINRKCEWKSNEIDTVTKMRKLIMSCVEDHRVLLFGYRWVFLDDLRKRKVAYDKTLTASAKPKKKAPPPKSSPKAKVADDVKVVIEMRDGGISYFYNSIEESLSAPGLPESIPVVRERLLTLAPGADFVEIGGRLWRHLASRGVSIELAASSKSLSEPAPRRPTNDVTIVKEDLVSGRRFLAGFSDINGAFEDWKETVEASIVEYDGPRTMEIFESFYLDGDRNIDGMRWRKRRKTDTSTSKAPSGKSFPSKVDDNVESAKPSGVNPAPEANGTVGNRQESSTSPSATAEGNNYHAEVPDPSPKATNPEPSGSRSPKTNGVYKAFLSPVVTDEVQDTTETTVVT